MSTLSAKEKRTNNTLSHNTGKQILIAEDEPIIRKLLQGLLNRWGYRTLVAHDGKEALQVSEEHVGDIDLLISDVTMPGIDGPELAERMTRKRPALKVILMSGFCHLQLALRRGWKFIQKPFKPSEIEDAVKEIL